ncbi:MAG: Sir2 family NAD-dependent protein deacetylase [Bacteroidota bacterium]
MIKLDLERIRRELEKAEALVLTIGAGMSADSGIPTYRGQGGAWGQLEGELKGEITDIMTPEFINRNPVLMWKRFARGKQKAHLYPPHKGYHVLKDWQDRFSLDTFVVSSNVDGMFQRVGFKEEQILEVHGSGAFQQCTLPCHQGIWENNPKFDPEKESVSVDELPRCPVCGRLARPNVFIFKDKTFVRKRVDEQRNNYDLFLARNEGKRFLVIEIGAGNTIKTIRFHTRRLIRNQNAWAIRINLLDAEIEHPHLGIAETALNSLTEINEYLHQ